MKIRIRPLFPNLYTLHCRNSFFHFLLYNNGEQDPTRTRFKNSELPLVLRVLPRHPELRRVPQLRSSSSGIRPEPPGPCPAHRHSRCHIHLLRHHQQRRQRRLQQEIRLLRDPRRSSLHRRPSAHQSPF